MQKIKRTKTVEGTVAPGIINNGGHYFFINVDIYEDGMVNCWKLVDLAELRQCIASGWLASEAPAGEQLSIHDLGSYKVEQASWLFDRSGYFQHLLAKVEALNPELANIYTRTEHEKKLLDMRKITYCPDAVNFTVLQETFYKTADGSEFPIFMKRDDTNYLVNLVVYDDGTVAHYDASHEQTYTLDEVKPLFDDGTFFVSCDSPTTIVIPELGEVVLSNGGYTATVKDKYAELHDMYNKLTGQKTSLDLCREAYYDYLEYPNETARTRLKEKYELVPEHERRYLGDMDTKDADYRRIVYQPEVKREV